MSVEARDPVAAKQVPAGTRKDAALSFDEIRTTVAHMIDEEPGSIGYDDDLVTLGLDSIGVMSLANTWRRRGANVTFGDLMENPTLAHWWARIEQCASTAEHDRIEDGDEAAAFDLAPMQHAYWVGRSEGLALGGNGSHFYFEFDGTGVQPARLNQAVQRLVTRHPMLRARFGPDGTQQITDDSRGVTKVNDLLALTADELEPALASLRRTLSHQLMDVSRGQVFDVQLTLLPDGRTRVHVDVEMLACDAASFRVLLTELATLYHDSKQSLPDLGLSYRDYLSRRQNGRVGNRARARDYWAERIDGMPSCPGLPLAVAPDLVRQPQYRRRHTWLDPGQRDRLAEQARGHGVTVSMALVTTFAEVLARWSTESRFLLNLPIFDRELIHPDVPALIGDFTNLILLEMDLSSEQPFAQRVRNVQQRFRADMAHNDYPGTSVLRDLARRRRSSAGVAPVVFTSALSLGELFPDKIRKVLGEPVWMSSETAQVWLDVQVVEHDGGLLINWESADDLFPSGVMAAMFDAYLTRLATLGARGADWNQPRDIPLPVGQQDVRHRVNDTAADIPAECLHDRFFRLASNEPEQLAVVDAFGAGLSYGEVAGRALSLAGCLRSHGLSDGDAVAIHLPKGVDQIIAVLGVLAAGGTYVPTGVNQPVHRRSQIYRTAGVGLVVTEAGADAGASPGWQPITMDEASRHAPLARAVLGSPEAIAYVIFTSGSTGAPKGVEVSHRAAWNTIRAISDRFQLGPQDRTLAVSALDFDLSIFDIFAPLSAGGAVVCVPEAGRRDARCWLDLCAAYGVTVLNCVPALLDMMLVAANDDGRSIGLRLVLLGGDWVGVDLPRRLCVLAPGCRFAGLGGTTETAIHSTVCEVDEVLPQWKAVPYGFPLPNQRCRVVDEHGRDCPDWVPGELWIGGASVAEGYRGDPIRTTDKFVRKDGCRWYRTGDLARYQPDGTLEFLGRADFQTKIDGYRVEPGEIESVLIEFPAVLAAAVVTVGGATKKRLAAMVSVLAVESFVDADIHRLRDFLDTRLPPYLIPEQIAVTGALPLSDNGKIDRTRVRTMLEAGADQPARTFEVPEGQLETTVAELWTELLGVPRVGRTDGFFAIGGDSLQATKLLGRLRAAGLHGGSLVNLFNKPVLRDFAATLRVGEKARPVVLAPQPAKRHEPFPATDVQRAYWIGRSSEFTLGGIGSHWYWEFDGVDVDVERLERIWNRLIRRHEMMRAVFDREGRQRILADTPTFCIRVDEVRDTGVEVALDDLRAQMSHRLFDVDQWPLFDVRAVQYSHRRTRIAFSFDYIVLDALSIMIIFHELATLYRDEEADLPAVDVSFRDYVMHTRASDTQQDTDKEYWSEQAAKLPPAPALPLAVEPHQVIAPRFSRREFLIPSPQWLALTTRARRHDLTPSTVLATAFAEVLASWSARPDLTITLTLFDRKNVHSDINNIVGDFTSLLLVGHEARTDRCWADTARDLQKQVWAGLQHSSVSAIWVLRELARRSGNAEMLMPAVFTSTLGVSDRLASLEIPFGEQVYGLSQTPQVYLDCQVVERPDGVAVNWDAVDEIFPAGMIDAMFDAYRRLLDWASTSDWTEPVPALLPEDQARIREVVNNTSRRESGRGLHEGFFANAREYAGRVALIGRDGATISYGELAARALSTARYLGECGVSRGTAVGVTLPKGPDQIAAVLGVLAAGACYVPIGAEQPAARRDRMLRCAGVRVVLTDAVGTSHSWPDSTRVVGITDALNCRQADAPIIASGAELAYVIFTSGSTGEPKGVEITHRAAVNTIEDINERYGIGARDRVLAVSALDFDLSAYDIFGLLSVGGALVLIDENDRREARHWVKLVREHEVTVWNTVPALLDMLLTVSGGDQSLPGLRIVLVSGDWIGLTVPARLVGAAPAATLVALGGATEAAIWSNAFEVDDVPAHWRSIPYGYPLANQRYRVVDGRGYDCPDWVPGELWIGGTGVARGYRDDPELTAAQFVEWHNQRWYRTGDLGRYWPSGMIELLGRIDHQVKIRGHRIELGEIESALQEHRAVAGAVAVAVGERTGRRLVAFVVSAGVTGHGDLGTELMSLLARRIPAYMVPERIDMLDRFPLNANGKVDRVRLVELAGQGGRAESPSSSCAPQGELESELAAVWAELLEVSSVGRHDSFFALGADSFLATSATEIVRKRFEQSLSLRQLFDAPTVAKLAALIDRVRQERSDAEEGVL